MEDRSIIALYNARDERAIQETERKYGDYCMSISVGILSDRMDAEECVNDTYLKAWNTIPPKRPCVFKMFLAKITRNLAFSRWRKFTAEKRGGGEMELVLGELEACLAAPGDVGDRLSGQELAKAIRAFLNTLPEREQNVFLRRYFFLEESQVIAGRYGMKPATVLRTLSRTRMKLKHYLTQEGYTV